jgi:hypothetical protein
MIADPLRLYNTSMGTDLRGGITRSGAGKVSDPYVLCGQAEHGRQAGQLRQLVRLGPLRQLGGQRRRGGRGYRERRVLPSSAATPIPSNGNQIFRNVGATVFLPSNDEWTKAALYDPGAGYWTYGTRSDALPTGATADANGNVSNAGPNVANYNFSADWNNQNGNVTTVGSCGPEQHELLRPGRCHGQRLGMVRRYRFLPRRSRCAHCVAARGRILSSRFSMASSPRPRRGSS